ncbi:MAG: glycoside hydrolase family 88 protein [Verrucomicrobia bacterium]|nr:glycoside hydrolase family 88 protein [Verrucomicrobiota bacterium]
MTSTDLVSQANSAFDFAERQLRHLVTNYPGLFPLYTQNGKWNHQSESWTNWCEGFLGGMLWLVAKQTGDAWWRGKAEEYSGLIEHRKLDRSVHDLGFLFLPTWKVWYELTGEKEKQQPVLEAGRTLALRYQEKGRYLQSFVAPESLFIDIMMNVEIIFYAARELGDENLQRIALEHCYTTRRYLVRGDGSTGHEAIFDLQTGEFLRQSTHQGWRGDSSWARGQGWGLSGFVTAYKYTNEIRFLNTAIALADYFIERTPAHGIPPNDWDQPSPKLAYESSAAAIAAGGLLDLGDVVTDPVLAEKYRQQARRTLATLVTTEFLAIQKPEWEGILLHGIYHERKGLGVDESVLWGDYFFLAALDKVLQNASSSPVQSTGVVHTPPKYEK